MRGRSKAPIITALLAAAAVAAALTGCAAVGEQANAGPTSPTAHEAPVDPTPGSADPMAAGAAIPSPTPGVTADAAAQAKAAAWLAGAVLPPGAVQVSSPPGGTSIDAQNQGWWCQPMAEADAYWTVSGMSMVDAANWLRVHPSSGLKVVYPQLETPDPDLTNDMVNDFPSPTSFEGMTFNLATWGTDGAVIHLELGVLSSNSTCATPHPGEQLMTAGG